MPDESLDLWIERLNDGDEAAVERVFAAYEPYLRIAVRRRLGRQLRARLDSNDVVQSVFADVLGGVRAGRWRFDGRAQLLAFLRKVAWRRLADHYQKHKLGLERECPLAGAKLRHLPAIVQPR